MADAVPIEAPSGYAPLHAVGWSDAGGECTAAAIEAPLPVRQVAPPAPAPLAGTAAGSKVAGPFVAAPDRPVYLTLAGAWTGEVHLLRSIDGGASRRPLTLGGQVWGRFTGNACEAVWQESEEGASLWLDLQPAGGVISYRLSQ